MMRQSFAAALVAVLFVGSTAFAQQIVPMPQHAAEHTQANPGMNHSMPSLEPGTTPSPKGPHGGSLKTVDGIQLETLVEPGGVRLFGYDAEGQPLDLRNARGVAKLKLHGVAKRYRYDLYPEFRQDQSAETLSVRVDLRQMAGHEGELSFQLVGLTGGRRPTTFSSEFVGPMTEQQEVAAAIAKQKVCPVSEQPLGSMGDPIPVTVDGETIYVCCAGCVEKVRANFAEYQQKLNPSPELTFSPATQADVDAIKLQQVCPVTDAPLGSMGTPLKVTGLAREVFLCCQGCVERFKSNPDEYLVKLPPLPTAKPEVTKATAADAKFVAAQMTCPVMEEPLDSMGGPYRTVVDGKVVYLCCPGCAKLLQAEPEKYLTELKAQGVTPPTAE